MSLRGLTLEIAIDSYCYVEITSPFFLRKPKPILPGNLSRIKKLFVRDTSHGSAASRPLQKFNLAEVKSHLTFSPQYVLAVHYWMCCGRL